MTRPTAWLLALLLAVTLPPPLASSGREAREDIDMPTAPACRP